MPYHYAADITPCHASLMPPICRRYAAIDAAAAAIAPLRCAAIFCCHYFFASHAATLLIFFIFLFIAITPTPATPFRCVADFAYYAYFSAMPPCQLCQFSPPLFYAMLRWLPFAMPLPPLPDYLLITPFSFSPFSRCHFAAIFSYALRCD